MGKTWSDIFYPGNPERRDKIVRLASRLYTIMEQNFSTVNDLVDFVNEHIGAGPQLEHIFVDRNATIKANSDILIDSIEKIQDRVKTVDQQLAEKIEPNLYQELKSPDLTFKNRLQKANKIFSVTLSSISTAVGIAVVGAIIGGAILVGAVAAIGLIATCAIAGFAIGILTLGVDVIAGAIFGAIERVRLNKTIDELESALEEFEPKSKKFQRSVLYVVVILEDRDSRLASTLNVPI